MDSKPKIAFANTLRGIAALAVVLSHYYGVFWLDRPLVEVYANTPLLTVTAQDNPAVIALVNSIPFLNWGAYGVALFFLISGFVIPFSLQKIDRVNFLINRLFRILPTYVVGFSISLLAVFLSSQYFARQWPYRFQEVLIHYFPGMRDLLWSRHIDGIIWTLEVEIKFYMLCAIFIFWFRQKSLKIFFIPVCLFLAALYLNEKSPAMAIIPWRLTVTYLLESQYVIYMFIGVLLHYLYQGKVKVYVAWLGILILYVLFYIQWSVGPYGDSLALAWSYLFALATFAFAFYFPKLFKGNRIFDFLANISYPLYVVHGVFGYVALRILLDAGLNAETSLALVTACSLFLAWLIHVLVERPAQLLGKRLRAYFN